MSSSSDSEPFLQPNLNNQIRASEFKDFGANRHFLQQHRFYLARRLWKANQSLFQATFVRVNRHF